MSVPTKVVNIIYFTAFLPSFFPGSHDEHVGLGKSCKGTVTYCKLNFVQKKHEHHDMSVRLILLNRTSFHREHRRHWFFALWTIEFGIGDILGNIGSPGRFLNIFYVFVKT